LPNTPGTEQAEEGLFLRIQADIARADNPQMTRPEIDDRSTFEILIDHCRRHV